MRFPRGERGAAAVEFALVVPVLLALLLGIAEFGRAYNAEATLARAAREGARAMALQNSTSAARTAAQTAASNLNLSASQIAIAPSSCPSTSAGSTPQTVVVSITYSMTYITRLFGSSVTLHGTGAMRCNG